MNVERETLEEAGKALEERWARLVKYTDSPEWNSISEKARALHVELLTRTVKAHNAVNEALED